MELVLSLQKIAERVDAEGRGPMTIESLGCSVRSALACTTTLPGI